MRCIALFTISAPGGTLSAKCPLPKFYRGAPTMSIPDTIHPWVAERKGQFRFAAQLNAGDLPEPGRTLVEAAKGIEELGFDGVFLGDHPVWTPDIYLHL